VLKGGRYAVEGANTLRGDAVGDVNGANAFMQVLGFAPADLIKQYEENAYLSEKGKAIRSIEKNALKKYYAAMREGDADGMMEAREKLFELGAKYPDLKISEKTITQSVKARERITNEMHHGVQLDRKLAPYLKQAAAEAYGD
jgi:flagellar biosynthesis/type III secretory pathway protein FliH